MLFRLCAAVHSTVRFASSSPRRADVVAMGADGSPTEALDRAAEARVLTCLEEEGLDWNVLSEEAGRVERGGTRTLVLDPIDGSHNALRGLPMSTVSLAVGSDTLGSIDAGVVRDLSSGATFWARRDGGAYRDGHRIRTRPWVPRQELFLLNLGRHATPRTVALAGRARRIRSLGCASLEMAMVGLGAADVYLFENEKPERNLRLTDIAAGYRIVLEAGGRVSDADGTPLDDVPLTLETHTSVLASGDPGFLASARTEGYL